MERDIFIKLLSAEMPERIRGFCRQESAEQDGSEYYIVVLNSSLPEDQQATAFLHECLHVFHRDHAKIWKDGEYHEAEMVMMEKRRKAELIRMFEERGLECDS